MIEIRFDEKSLLTRLEPLSDRQRLLFGTACAERLFGNYVRFAREVEWGNDVALRRALDAAWKTCSGSAPDGPTLARLLVECEAAAPESEEFDSLFTASAQDAVFATCSLLDFIGAQSIEKIVASARYPTDSIDLYVQELEGMSAHDPTREDKILRHPLMQQELWRQRRDLDEARKVLPDDAQQIEGFKRRAQSEGAFEVAAYNP